MDTLAASLLRYDEGSRVDIGLHEPVADADLEGHLLAAVHRFNQVAFAIGVHVAESEHGQTPNAV